MAASHARLTVAAVGLLLLSACGSGGAEEGAGGRGGPVQVGYIVIQASSVPVEQSLPGRVAAFQISDVRPQGSGVVRRRVLLALKSTPVW